MARCPGPLPTSRHQTGIDIRPLQDLVGDNRVDREEDVLGEHVIIVCFFRAVRLSVLVSGTHTVVASGAADPLPASGSIRISDWQIMEPMQTPAPRSPKGIMQYAGQTSAP